MTSDVRATSFLRPGPTQGDTRTAPMHTTQVAVTHSERGVSGRQLASLVYTHILTLRVGFD
jgi:hypothetical protein